MIAVLEGTDDRLTYHGLRVRRLVYRGYARLLTTQARTLRARSRPRRSGWSPAFRYALVHPGVGRRRPPR